jgi:hypothetical protein
MNPVQKRTGLASALSHDSQEVTPGGRVAVQLDSSTLLPAPADPTTMVSRWPAPAVSWSRSTDLVTSVAGSVAGRNFASANRRPREASPSAIAPSATTHPGWFPALGGYWSPPLYKPPTSADHAADSGITLQKVMTPTRPPNTLAAHIYHRIKGRNPDAIPGI